MLDTLTMQYPHPDDTLMFVDHGVHGGLRKEDVWGYGYYDKDMVWQKVHDGLVVARTDEICPVWGDRLPYKSSTLVIPEGAPTELVEAVEYWVSYVMGGSPTRKTFQPDGTVALRADYQAW